MELQWKHWKNFPTALNQTKKQEEENARSYHFGIVVKFDSLVLKMFTENFYTIATIHAPYDQGSHELLL